MPDEEEIADVLPAEETDDMVEEVEEVEDIEEVEEADDVEEATDDLEVVGGGQKRKKKKKVKGVTDGERTTAMWIYLSALLPGVGFFGPLIIC